MSANSEEFLTVRRSRGSDHVGLLGELAREELWSAVGEVDAELAHHLDDLGTHALAAIGIDMADEMLELARENAAEAGVENVEFQKGYLEDLSLPDTSVDVVSSNCVINLSADKPKILAEAARVLRPEGRFAVSDVIADPDMNDAPRADMAAWTGCIAGALTEEEFREALAAAGLEEVEIRETHRMHEHAAAAIIRARKPR